MSTFEEQFTAYLSQPCDEPDCDRSAIYNGAGRATGARGKWCNAHVDNDQPLFSRDD